MNSDLRLYPERYAFFQAVRLLENARRAARNPARAVGEDASPADEVVRFTTQTALSHPSGEVTRITQKSAEQGEHSGAGVTNVEVSFMGLTGPNGVLPEHYTSLLLTRLRANDRSLRDFLNLFNHRLISLFYRAHEKYHFALGYERAAAASKTDSFTATLNAFTGMGTPGLTGRGAADPVVLGFSGMFSRQVRPAAALRAILQSYFDLPFRIEQFSGQWLRLDADQQLRLPVGDVHTEHFNRLAVDAMLGERVRDVQGRFAVIVGPVTNRQFQSFLPTTHKLKKLCQVIRHFVGPEFDFEVRFELPPKEVPMCRLGGETESASRLAWNTWSASLPFPNTVNDAAFSLENV